MSSDLSTTRSPPSCSASSPSSGRDTRIRTPPRGEAAAAIEATSTSGSNRSRRPWRLINLGATSWALDPRARWVREWNRAYLLACAAGLMVDPLFLYTACVSGPAMCLFLDGWLAAAVTALRCAVDAMHAWNVATQLRVVAPGAVAAPRKRDDGDDEERQVAASSEAEEEEQEGAEALRKLRAYAVSKKGMVLDFFVILPVMQLPRAQLPRVSGLLPRVSGRPPPARVAGELPRSSPAKLPRAPSSSSSPAAVLLLLLAVSSPPHLHCQNPKAAGPAAAPSDTARRDGATAVSASAGPPATTAGPAFPPTPSF